MIFVVLSTVKTFSIIFSQFRMPLKTNLTQNISNIYQADLRLQILADHHRLACAMATGTKTKILST